jgi:type I restriction enzyme S subunit
MKRWPTKPLGEICAINPKLLASEAPAADTEVTFVPMAAVDEISGNIARPEFRKYSQVAKGYTPFRENDVLFAKITPCMENGKAAIARGLRGGLGFGSTEFHVIRPSASLLPEWVFALIRQPSFRETAKANFTGTAGQQRVPTDFLKTFPIPMPSRAEQERIVKLLDEADELRKLRDQSNRRTTALIPALFHEMFSDPATNPQGWPIVSLGEIGGGGQYGLNAAAMTEGAGVRFIRITDIDDFGRLGRCESAFVPENTPNLDEYTLTDGDILIARSGATAGKAYVHEPLKERSVFAGYLIRFKINQALALPIYVFSFLKSDAYWTQLNSHKRAVAQPNVNAKQLASLRFPLPPLSLQKEFAQRVKEIRELEASQATSRTRLDALFQSMLHRAFNGEL